MDLPEIFRTLTTLVFDVDGVLTDGTLTILPDGVMARKMNVKDGYGLQLAVKKGYNVVIISDGASKEVEERLYKLGVSQVFMRVTNKLEVLSEYLETKHLSWNEVMFMGDDIPDIAV